MYILMFVFVLIHINLCDVHICGRIKNFAETNTTMSTIIFRIKTPVAILAHPITRRQLKHPIR